MWSQPPHAVEFPHLPRRVLTVASSADGVVAEVVVAHEKDGIGHAPYISLESLPRVHLVHGVGGAPTQARVAPDVLNHGPPVALVHTVVVAERLRQLASHEGVRPRERLTMHVREAPNVLHVRGVGEEPCDRRRVPPAAQ